MRGTFIHFRLSPFNVHGLCVGGGGGEGCLRLLLSAAALLVCKPADRRASAEHAFRLRFHRTLLPDWVGGRKGVWTSL